MPSAEVTLGETFLVLPSIEPPPVPPTVLERRQLALQSIQSQREGVQEQMLATRLSVLPDLEERWKAELQDSLDFASVWQAWDQQWFEAFQQYGQRRYFPLAVLAFEPPTSPAYQSAQMELNLIDWLWSLQQEALRSSLQEQLDHLNQELEVRLRARRRDFIRQAESEVDSLLATQPDWQSLYLPTPLPPASLPEQSLEVAAIKVQISSKNLNLEQESRFHQTEQIRLAILRQLAQEWAQGQGYRLTNNPNALDHTEAFLDYLLNR